MTVLLRWPSFVIVTSRLSRCLTNFVVAGGGFSGVEAAGEIQDLMTEAVDLFKRVDREDCHVHIVHGRDHLLPEVSPSLGKYAERLMAERGVKVHLNQRVASSKWEITRLRR